MIVQHSCERTGGGGHEPLEPGMQDEQAVGVHRSDSVRRPPVYGQGMWHCAHVEIIETAVGAGFCSFFTSFLNLLQSNSTQLRGGALLRAGTVGLGAVPPRRAPCQHGRPCPHGARCACATTALCRVCGITVQ